MAHARHNQINNTSHDETVMAMHNTNNYSSPQIKCESNDAPLIWNAACPTMNHIIGTEQNGFVPCRFIAENNMLLHEIIEYTTTNKHEMEGMLLFLDFNSKRHLIGSIIPSC